MLDDEQRSAGGDEETEESKAQPERKRPAKKKQEAAPEPPPPPPEHLVTVINRIQEQFADLKPSYRKDGWVEVFVPREKIVEIGTFLRDDAALGFHFLSCVSGVDNKDKGFQVVYHLINLHNGNKLLMKVDTPRDDARVPSVVPVWATADWHEREAWDLMGIVFDDHPNLRRILMREDWEGHPLRKDYEDRRPHRERQVKEAAPARARRNR